MNMCSLRQRPMPSAPNSRARVASSGVSAFARTPRRRISSAHVTTCWKSSFTCGGTSGSAPANTSPVEPSSVITSPSANVWPPISTVRASTSMRIDSAPATQGLPMPRATTAAWLVMPPCAVSTPWAAITPWMSSGVVSQRTRTTASPPRPRRSALSASSTIAPTAAPGDAFRPRTSGSPRRSGSMRRVQQLVEAARVDAADGLLALDHALGRRGRARCAARPASVRLPVRVCSR